MSFRRLMKDRESRGSRGQELTCLDWKNGPGCTFATIQAQPCRRQQLKLPLKQLWYVFLKGNTINQSSNVLPCLRWLGKHLHTYCNQQIDSTIDWLWIHSPVLPLGFRLVSLNTLLNDCVTDTHQKSDIISWHFVTWEFFEMQMTARPTKEFA